MTAARPLAALADPTRRRVYERIVRRPQSVGELTRGLGVSQPAVSQHLAVLRRARLVRARAEGRQRIYSTDPAGIAALRAYLDRMWTDALGAYARSFEEEAS
jgi:DNA-binding transcriptional ArsR family regulator